MSARNCGQKTNGLLLNPEDNQRLIESGLDMIGVSINAVSGDGYLKVTKTKLDYEKLVAGVTNLCERARGTQVRVLVKIANSGFSPDEIRKFYDDFSAAELLSVEQLHGWAGSDEKDWTLGTNPTTFEGGALVDKIACPLPFFMLAVNWNGTVGSATTTGCTRRFAATFAPKPSRRFGRVMNCANCASCIWRASDATMPRAAIAATGGRSPTILTRTGWRSCNG